MARVSGSARFCSHCGSPILVAQAAAGATPLHCPACGGASQLASRRLGAEPVAVSECALCGGLWVDRAAFEVLVVRARHAQLGAPALALVAAADEPAGHPAAAWGGGPTEHAASAAGAGPTEDAASAAGGGPAAPAPGGRLYRPCAVCGALMNRQNYGRKSGVILDLCRAHGIWFDLDELPRVLSWIQNGGEQRAGQLDAEEARAAARERRLGQDAGRAEAEWVGYGGQPDRDLLGGLTDLLDEGIRRLFHRF
jgi:Zn-finger nucleic acid-binding protein